LTEKGLCGSTPREDLLENAMKKEDKKSLMQAVMASTIGYQVAFAPFIGIAIGVFLDLKLGTGPYLTIVFLIVGIAAGGLNYYRFAKQQQEEDKGRKQ
jgi:ATP synthase protein I